MTKGQETALWDRGRPSHCRQTREWLLFATEGDLVLIRSIACVLAMFLCFATAPATGTLAADRLPWTNEVVGRHMLLRPSVNASQILYLRLPGTTWIAELDGRCYPLRSAEPATVEAVDVDSTSIALRIATQHLGKATVKLRPEDSTGVLQMGQQAVAATLALLDEQSRATMYWADPTSHMLHYAGSNHGLYAEPALPYATVDDATSAGMRPCPICFQRIHVLPDYEEEMAIGRLTSGEVRSAYQLIDSIDMNERLQRVGNTVLAHWPIPLREYSYRFSVIDRDDFNAVACPGGWLFLSNSLMDACESDAELEAVIAHEVAHVEMRHGIRQYRQAQHTAVLVGIVADIAGAAAAGEDNNTAIAGLVTGTMLSLALALSYTGYIQAFEEEADSYALLYLMQIGSDDAREPLVNVLRKLQYSGEVLTGGRERRALFSSHPSIAGRV